MTLDTQQCKAALDVLYKPNDIIELRAIGARGDTPKWKNVTGGYYNDREKLIRDVAELNGSYSGIYMVLNKVAPELLARSANRLTDSPKHTTSDNDILRRIWLFIDFDPKRPPGIAATDEEQRGAFDCAREVREWLTAQGWPEPVRADSGNGVHLLYRVDLPNDDASKLLIEQCLTALSFRFSNQQVDVDQSTHNAARLGKLYGSAACKGDPLPDRPHRLSRIVKAPDPVVSVHENLLKRLAQMTPKEENKPQASPNYNGKAFDLDLWIANSGLEVAKTGPWNGGRKWVLAKCPWNADHTDRAAYIIQQASGAIGAGCQHSSCGKKKWPDLRDVVEPGWREELKQKEVKREQRVRPFTETDDGNADRLVKHHGTNLRYCYELGWLNWDGQRWTQDTTGEVRRRAVETVKDIGDEAKAQDDQGKSSDLFKWASSCLSDAKLKAMISSAQSKLPMPVAITDFDTNLYLLNVNNGTIDLKTGELRRHRREDKMMKLAPVDYAADAQCPDWLGFLDRIMDGNHDLIEFMQRAVGYSLTGSTAEECLFILYGNGANGKSTFLETVEALVGDYASKTPTETLMARRNDSGQTNDIARLRGARFVSSIETEEGRQFAEAKLKDLTGGDKVTARFLHQEFFEYRPEFKLWLGCNHKPNIRGTDDGIWRRVRLIPFEVQIPEAERDPSLKGPDGKLQAELPGILNWALEGLRHWQEGGLDIPGEVLSATMGYRTDMDVIGTFIDECSRVNDKANCKTADLYNRYSEWCDGAGERPVSKKKFGTKLSERGFINAKGTGGTRMWWGIGLESVPDGL